MSVRADSRAVLVTGAGGFVGSHLAEGFQALGYHVVAFDRAFDTATAWRLQACRLVEAALTRDALQALGETFDLVIHAAALTTLPEEMGISDAVHMRINLDLLLDCLDFTRTVPSCRFVFLSSSGVFALDQAEPLRESTVPAGRSAYALAKRASELIVTGMDGTLVARLGPIYGPHEASRPSRRVTSPVDRWLENLAMGEAIFVDQPGSRRDWTFAPDLAPALHALFKGGAGLQGILHLTSAEIIGDIELAGRIAAFRPGCDVSVAHHADAIRVPMASERRELADYPWTPLSRGLASTWEARS